MDPEIITKETLDEAFDLFYQKHFGCNAVADKTPEELVYRMCNSSFIEGFLFAYEMIKK
jgi:hypothetical protein